MINESDELKRSGYNFLGLLNDIKRRPEDAAKELEISLEEINSMIKGEKEIPLTLIKKAIKKWPLNRVIFLVNGDSLGLS